MNFITDTHTHSISSGHAYSSIEEMAKVAREKNFKMLFITDHGPKLPGASTIIHFRNLKVIMRYINGVRVVGGVEANIIDYNGKIDIDERTCKRLEYIIASFHNICIKTGDVKEHTNAALNAIKNPYIDVIGHPGNPEFQVDIEKLVLACKDLNKPVEINNHSFKARKGSYNNCMMFLELCKKYEVNIVCGSDAHLSYEVGTFNRIEEMLKRIDFPEDLILNSSIEKISKYLEERHQRIKKLKGDGVD